MHGTCSIGTVAPSDSTSEAADSATETPDSATATTDTASTGAIPEEITGDTLFASEHSGVLDARTTTLEDDGAWEEAWNELVSNIAPAPERPAVDFTEQRAVLIAMGQQSTGGYAIEVSALVSDEGSLTVHFVERAPGPTCITTQALTAPALVLAVPRGAGPIDFERTRVVTDCG